MSIAIAVIALVISVVSALMAYAAFMVANTALQGGITITKEENRDQ